jgi:hypothetical protein
MNTAQRLDGDMIEAYLKSKGWQYSKKDDEHFVMVGSYQDQCGCNLTFRLLIEGSDKDLYVIRVIADKAIPRSRWGRAMVLCNDWNNDKRWPRAYLNRQDYSADTTNYIILDGHIDVSKGIHQELFNDFSDWLITGSIDFWERAHKERGW